MGRLVVNLSSSESNYNFIIDFHCNTSYENKVMDKRSPLSQETFHPECLQEERPLNFTVSFFKVNL
jgi:hypothetical protein